jgi:hypothetical protein
MERMILCRTLEHWNAGAIGTLVYCLWKLWSKVFFCVFYFCWVRAVDHIASTGATGPELKLTMLKCVWCQQFLANVWRMKNDQAGTLFSGSTLRCTPRCKTFISTCPCMHSNALSMHITP